MSVKASRDVLDWFRTWAQGRLTVIGRSDIGSNMNVSLNSDVRVAAAIGYVEQIESDVWAIWQPSWEPLWQNIGDSLTWWTDMPTNVRADWGTLWADDDPNVKRLLKATIRMVGMVELANAAGA